MHVYLALFVAITFNHLNLQINSFKSKLAACALVIGQEDDK